MVNFLSTEMFTLSAHTADPKICDNFLCNCRILKFRQSTSGTLLKYRSGLYCDPLQARPVSASRKQVHPNCAGFSKFGTVKFYFKYSDLITDNHI